MVRAPEEQMTVGRRESSLLQSEVLLTHAPVSLFYHLSHCVLLSSLFISVTMTITLLPQNYLWLMNMKKIYFSPNQLPKCGSLLAGMRKWNVLLVWTGESFLWSLKTAQSLLWNKVWYDWIFIPKCTNMNVWQARTVINNICKQYYLFWLHS